MSNRKRVWISALRTFGVVFVTTFAAQVSAGIDVFTVAGLKAACIASLAAGVKALWKKYDIARGF